MTHKVRKSMALAAALAACGEADMSAASPIEMMQMLLPVFETGPIEGQAFNDAVQATVPALDVYLLDAARNSRFDDLLADQYLVILGIPEARGGPFEVTCTTTSSAFRQRTAEAAALLTSGFEPPAQPAIFEAAEEVAVNPAMFRRTCKVTTGVGDLGAFETAVSGIAVSRVSLLTDDLNGYQTAMDLERRDAGGLWGVSYLSTETEGAPIAVAVFVVDLTE